MHVAVDASELLLRLEHARRAPAQRHLPVAPALHLGRAVAADLDHGLHAVRASERPSQRGRHAEAADGEGVRQALAQRRGGAVMRAVELLRQRLQVALADKRVGVVLGGAHATLDDAGDVLGQVATDIPDLTSGDHRVVERSLHRRRQGLGAVEDEQRRFRRVQATVAQRDE